MWQINLILFYRRWSYYIWLHQAWRLMMTVGCMYNVHTGTVESYFLFLRPEQWLNTTFNGRSICWMSDEYLQLFSTFKTGIYIPNCVCQIHITIKVYFIWWLRHAMQTLYFSFHWNDSLSEMKSETKYSVVMPQLEARPSTAASKPSLPWHSSYGWDKTRYKVTDL